MMMTVSPDPTDAARLRELRLIEELSDERHLLSILLSRCTDYLDHLEGCAHVRGFPNTCDCGLKALRKAIDDL